MVSYLWRCQTSLLLTMVLSFQLRMGQCLSPNLPPLPEATTGPTDTSKKPKKKTSKPKKRDNNTYHTSDFGARQNHPTSYDPSPPFLGPILMESRIIIDGDATTTSKSKSSYTTGRERIQHYYQRHSLLTLGRDTSLTTKTLKPSSPTKQKLKAIVEHLAHHNAPVDVKEVCESIEFVLRTRKRLLGASKQQQQQQQQQQSSAASSSSKEATTTTNTIRLYDLCCGHGLTGMLFSCCNDDKTAATTKLEVVLVDQTQPPSHAILLQLLVKICPWIEDSITFREASLDDTTTMASLSPLEDDLEMHDDGSRTINLVISTHACGSLTDRVLQVASSSNSRPNDDGITDQTTGVTAVAAAIAVMPCCYTGTSQGTPFGIQRALGVAWAADIQRSYHLQAQGYHADFATIPREITPMNRIIIGEFKGSTAPTA